LLLMVPFGYHLVPQNAEIRTLTGQLFAFGLVYYLTLNPFFSSERWRPLAPPAAGLAGENLRGYLLLALLSLPALQVAVHAGGATTAVLLSGLGFVGLLIYAALAGANLAVLSVTALYWLRRAPSLR